MFFAMTHAGEITRKLNSSLSTGFKREKKKISICSSSTRHDCVVFLQLSVSSINYFLVIHSGVRVPHWHKGPGHAAEAAPTAPGTICWSTYLCPHSEMSRE